MCIRDSLQAADGGKGIANAANELCGIALVVVVYFRWREAALWPFTFFLQKPPRNNKTDVDS